MKLTIISIGFAFALSSCASMSRLTTNALGAAGGATLGHALSDGDPYLTAAGAAGGLLIGEGLNHAQTTQTKKAFTEGYDQGRSDAVKQQYWMLVGRQRADGDAHGRGIGLLDIPLPEQMPDGMRFHSGATRTLRIEE